MATLVQSGKCWLLEVAFFYIGTVPNFFARFVSFLFFGTSKKSHSGKKNFPLRRRPV
jgi:hypothetical protein